MMWDSVGSLRRGLVEKAYQAPSYYYLLRRQDAGSIIIIRNDPSPDLPPLAPSISPSFFAVSQQPPPSPQLDRRTTLASAIPPDYPYVAFDESRAVRV